MSSILANENEKRLLETSSGRKIGKSQSLVMSKLEKMGKNDSVKSTYSLSVFIDPNASKDMGRQEELWYTMYEPEKSEGERKASSNLELDQATTSKMGKKELITAMETQGKERKVPKRDASESMSSVNSQRTRGSDADTGSDAERFFSRNTVAVGMGDSDVPGKNSEGTSKEIRQHSIAMQQAETGENEEEEKEEEEEFEETAEKELINAESRVALQAKAKQGQGHQDRGTSDESEEFDHRYTQEVQDRRSDAKSANDSSKSAAAAAADEEEEDADDRLNGWRTRQSDAEIYSRSDSDSEAKVVEHRSSQLGASKERTRDNSYSPDQEGGTAAYQSNMQKRHSSSGYLRERTAPSRSSDNDVGRYQSTKQKNYGDRVNSSRQTNSYLSLTDGSDEGEIRQSTHRDAIQGRQKFARPTSTDTHARPTRYESQSSSTSTYSVPRNDSSAARENDFSLSQRKRNPISKREGIQRRATKSENQDSDPDRVRTPTAQSAYVRMSSEDDTPVDDDDRTEHFSSQRVNSTYNTGVFQGPDQMESSEEESETGEISHRRQRTPSVNAAVHRSSSGEPLVSRQMSSDEENRRNEVMNSRRNIPVNRRSVRSPDSSRSTSEAQDLPSDYEIDDLSGHDMEKLYHSNSAAQSDQGFRHQPRPAQRTKKPINDSGSSMDYSSSIEAYRSRLQNQKNAKSKSKDTAAGRFGWENNQNLGDQPWRNRGYDQGNAIYSDPSTEPPIRSRKTVRQNAVRVVSNYSDSSTVSQDQGSYPRRRPVPTDRQMRYSDDSESDDHSTRTGQKVVVDFGSESDNSYASDEMGQQRQSKTTVVTKRTTPVTGVLTVDETTPRSSPLAVRREIRTVTTPVTGVVSIDDSVSSYRQRKVSSQETRRTPVAGLISVHRTPSPERAKTPVVGLITPRESQTKSVTRTSTTTPVRGVINVDSTPTPDRSKTPVVGIISSRQSPNTTTFRTRKITDGEINIINTRSVKAPTVTSSTIRSDHNNNNNYRRSFYPSQVETTIDTVLVPADNKEIVGVDPELRKAQKTGTNYRITMNLRPVIDDTAESGYEMHNMRTRSATPNSFRRSNSLRGNGGWDLNPEYLRSGSRSSTLMSNTLGSRRNGLRTPSNQFGFDSDAVNRADPYSGWTAPRRRSSSLYQEKTTLRPEAQSVRDYWASSNEPTVFREISRSAASSTMTNGSRSRSKVAGQRNDLHFGQPTMIHLQPIHQTVTSRPTRNPGQDRLTVGGGGGGGGASGRAFRGQLLPQSLSSSLSSVFMSPTMDRSVNRNARTHSNFRNDSYQRIGHFY